MDSKAISASTRWAIAAAIAAALLLAYPLRYVLLPFVAAGALAYIARPIVHWLQRRGWPHWAAALVPFLLFLLILGAAVYGIYSIFIPQLVQMLNNTQKMLEEFLGRIFHGKQIDLMGQKLTAESAAGHLLDAAKRLAGSDTLLLVTSGVTALMGCVLTVVIFAFLIFTGPQLAHGLLWLIPPKLRTRTKELAMQIDPMLASYLRGVFVIVLFAGAATYIVAGLIFHVSNAIFLAIAVGLLEAVPVVGPILSFVTFGLVAVQEKGIGSIIGFGVFAIGLRLVIDQLVGPLVLGRAARIPPLVVIFAFLTGGALYGILGVILAIPVAAAIKIALADLYEGSPGPGPAPG